LRFVVDKREEGNARTLDVTNTLEDCKNEFWNGYGKHSALLREKNTNEGTRDAPSTDFHRVSALLGKGEPRDIGILKGRMVHSDWFISQLFFSFLPNITFLVCRLIKKKITFLIYTFDYPFLI